jgi:hypothetical protein
MDELEFEQWLNEQISIAADKNEEDEELPDPVYTILSFRQAGILTSNKGLVLNMKDGSQFQVTIVKSK